jgi:hypothetical protein
MKSIQDFLLPFRVRRVNAHTPTGMHTLRQESPHSDRNAHTPTGTHTLRQECTHSDRNPHTPTGMHTLRQECTHSDRNAHTPTRKTTFTGKNLGVHLQCLYSSTRICSQNHDLFYKRYFRLSFLNCVWGSTVFHLNSHQRLLADTNLQSS